MVAVLAALFCALTGRPVEAVRWADAVDRWQYEDPARPGDPSTEAWAAVMRTFLCRHGVEQMRADADEAVRRFATQSFMTPAPAFLQGIARLLCGDVDSGDASLEDGISLGEEVGAHEDVALALCERSLVAIARRMGTGRGFRRSGTRRFAPGRDRGKLRNTSGLRGAGPRGHAPGRCPGSAPGTRYRLAAAAFADLRPALLRRADPDRAHPRPCRAG